MNLQTRRSWIILLYSAILLAACSGQPSGVASLSPSDSTGSGFEENQPPGRLAPTSILASDSPADTPRETLVSSVIPTEPAIQALANTSTQPPTALFTGTSTPLAASTNPSLPAAPLPTDSPDEQAPPQPARIIGRILFNGEPPEQSVRLFLEDRAYQVIEEISTSNGEYVFSRVPASDSGYNVLFSQSLNPQYDPLEVISWGWIGPVAVQDGFEIVLPDLEVSTIGLDPIQPQEGAFVSMTAITTQTPLLFEWSPYPVASQYWVELRSGPAMELVWQSNYSSETRVAFDGTLTGGERISPGSYWWSIGVRIQDPPITIVSPLRGFNLRP